MFESHPRLLNNNKRRLITNKELDPSKVAQYKDDHLTKMNYPIKMNNLKCREKCLPIAMNMESCLDCLKFHY